MLSFSPLPIGQDSMHSHHAPNTNNRFANAAFVADSISNGRAFHFHAPRSSSQSIDRQSPDLLRGGPVAEPIRVIETSIPL